LNQYLVIGFGSALFRTRMQPFANRTGTGFAHGQRLRCSMGEVVSPSPRATGKEVKCFHSLLARIFSSDRESTYTRGAPGLSSLRNSPAPVNGNVKNEGCGVAVNAWYTHGTLVASSGVGGRYILDRMLIPPGIELEFEYGQCSMKHQ
jgi:hypothetical protein